MLFFFFAISNLNGAEGDADRGIDRLSVRKNHVYAISTFNEIDYFSVYSDSGAFAWEVPFNSAILSWKTNDEFVFIFSRSRTGLAYYVTCIEPLTGKILWEKPIYAPMQIAPDEEQLSSTQSSVE